MTFQARAWLASYVDGPGLALAASDHADYGDAYAPSLAYGEGPFGESLAPLFRFFGRPNPTKAKTWEILARLRAASEKEAARRIPGALAKAGAEDQRLERALLEEVDRRATGYSGPGGLDARAVRAAITVLRVFRPALLVVRPVPVPAHLLRLRCHGWPLPSSRSPACGREQAGIRSIPE